MGYSARRGFTNGKISGAARQAELQQKIAAMQEKMTEEQDAVEAQEFTASVGGGVVEAKVNGKKEVLSVTIKPEAVVIAAQSTCPRSSPSMARGVESLVIRRWIPGYRR